MGLAFTITFNCSRSSSALLSPCWHCSHHTRCSLLIFLALPHGRWRRTNCSTKHLLVAAMSGWLAEAALHPRRRAPQRLRNEGLGGLPCARFGGLRRGRARGRQSAIAKMPVILVSRCSHDDEL